MVRVLQVLGSLNMGGAESRMIDVLRNINRDTYNIDFLILQKDKQYYENEVRALGSTIHKLPMPTKKTLLAHIQEVRKIIRDGRYDAVHAHTSYHSGIIMYAAWREHVPIRITHARTTGSNRKNNELMSRFGKKMIHIFATNRLAISKDAGIFLFGKDKYEVLPNAIDVQRYQKINEDKIRMLRAEYQIPQNAFVIGQIGRFDSMKNHEFTVRWFKQYPRENAVLVFVGDGPLRKKIEEQTKGMQVRYTGIINNVNEVIHLFDVNLLPSTFEGLGGVILEAQAAGIPSIVSDNLPEEIDMGIGLVRRCPLDNLAAWNNAVELSKKRGDYLFISEAFDKKNYTLQSEISRLEDLYLNG